MDNTKLIYSNKNEEIKVKKEKIKNSIIGGVALLSDVFIIILLISILSTIDVEDMKKNSIIPIPIELILLIGCLIFLFFIVLFLLMTIRHSPFRVYENGLTFPRDQKPHHILIPTFIPFNKLEKIMILNDYFIIVTIKKDGNNKLLKYFIYDFVLDIEKFKELLNNRVVIESKTTKNVYESFHNKYQQTV